MPNPGSVCPKTNLLRFDISCLICPINLITQHVQPLLKNKITLYCAMWLPYQLLFMAAYHFLESFPVINYFNSWWEYILICPMLIVIYRVLTEHCTFLWFVYDLESNQLATTVSLEIVHAENLGIMLLHLYSHGIYFLSTTLDYYLPNAWQQFSRLHVWP
jgi:hypothetical protein